MSQGNIESYNNSHRAFLQAFIARSTFTLDEAKPVFASIFSAQNECEFLTEDVTEADFNTYISVLNTAISPYDLQIRSTVRQHPLSNSRSSLSNDGNSARQRIYALVNTTSDSLAQLATVHTPDEMAFVQRMLDDMFEKYNTPMREIMAITSTQAVNLGRAGRSSGRNSLGNTNGESQSNVKSLSGAQAQEMLKSLVNEGWFERHGEFYTLTPRALIELRRWLRDTYDEPPDEENEDGVQRIKHCRGCGDIVTMGQRCQNRDCATRLHDHCVEQVFLTQRGRRECPQCDAGWTGRHFVGPKAATNNRASGMSNGTMNGRRSSSGTGAAPNGRITDSDSNG